MLRHMLHQVFFPDCYRQSSVGDGAEHAQCRARTGDPELGTAGSDPAGLLHASWQLFCPRN